MALRDLLRIDRPQRMLVDDGPVRGAAPRIVPHKPTTSEAVLEALLPRNATMPENPTNPFDQAIRDYQLMVDKLDKLQGEYNALDDSYVKACDAARAWQAKSEMHEAEAGKLRKERDEAIRKVVELATMGKTFVDLGASMVEIANAVPDTFKPKPKADPVAAAEAAIADALNDPPPRFLQEPVLTNTPRAGETPEQIAARTAPRNASFDYHTDHDGQARFANEPSEPHRTQMPSGPEPYWRK